MKEVLSFGRYLRSKFGVAVYKVPISLPGFTCPNIDGTVAKGGCTFCENESFSPNFTQEFKQKFTLSPNTQHNPMLPRQLAALDAQYASTKAGLSKKFGAKKFIVYFQSFSNTYAPLETLKIIYEHSLSLPDVIGISIGTRTDCVDELLLEYLHGLSQKYEVWVEYGIQSFNDDSLRKINRGHDVQNIIDGISLAKKYSLNVCGHLIFGLPDETPQMMLDSFEKAIDLGVNSLKIHPLYVVKNTALAASVKSGSFVPIDEELFLQLLVKCISQLPDGVSIQRISAGIDNDTLLKPLWCRNKHEQIKHAKEALLRAGLVY